MKIQKYLTQNLPRLQEAVENKLEVEFGDIKILPSESYWGNFEESFEGKFTLFTNPIMGNNIYVFSPRERLFSKEVLDYMEVHELAHLAHFNIVDNPLHPSLKSKRTFEGFAEYITENIIKNHFKLDNPINIVYKNEYQYFKSEVIKNNLKTAKDFKQYLRNFTI